MISKLRSIKEQVLHRDRYRYLKNRRIDQYAHYSLNTYKALLKNLVENDKYEFRPFTYTDTSAVSDVYIRHDIDTLACTERMSSMFDVNLSFGLPSSAFFRVDDDEYCLKDVRDQVVHYKNQGIEMGLHSVCYVEDDYLNELKRETQKFADEVGFLPKTFTVHGLGDFRKSVRNEFYDVIVTRLKEFGYDFTDAGSRLRNYYYVIEDCHVDKRLSKRFIYNDFVDYPGFLKKEQSLLLLTHPCYWH